MNRSRSSYTPSLKSITTKVKLMVTVVSNFCPCGLTTVVTSLRFGWGAAFVQQQGLLAIYIFFNFFAPGHGKGICDSEGGVAKHAVALAALHQVKLISPHDLYTYLKEHCVDVSSKTSSALHSPDRRDYHYFKDGEFLNIPSILKLIESIAFTLFVFPSPTHSSSVPEIHLASARVVVQLSSENA